jgi:magnesium-transporting ATPase (P-type)
VDQREPLGQLFSDLGSSPDGLTSVVAADRLVRDGANQLSGNKSVRWPGERLAQFTQPLAILLAAAAALAWVGGTPALSFAVIAVILLNAAFAFVQEMQAERAVDALAAYLTATVRVERDGAPRDVDAADIVRGDLVIVTEGDRICADSRILDGGLLIDLSALTGESAPASRSATSSAATVPLLQTNEMVFSGTTCTGGEARTVVTRTGMHTELGRIATSLNGERASRARSSIRSAERPGSSPSSSVSRSSRSVSPPASAGARPSASPSDCWSRTSPRDFSPPSPLLSPSASASSPTGEPWSSGLQQWRPSARRP